MLLERLPHHDFEDHPIFQFTARRVRGARSAATLRRYTLLVGGGILLGATGLWALAVEPSFTACLTQNRNCYMASSDSGALLVFLAVGSVALDVILDFACIIAAFLSMNNEHTGVHWDLLRLTEQQEQMIIDVKHALAKVRAWRVMTVVVALRLAVAWLLLLQLFVFEFILTPSANNIWSQPDAWMSLIGVAVFFVVFIIEPIWRMRAVTALGLAIMMRFRSSMSGSLAAFGALLLLWIVQVLIMGAMLWITMSFANGTSTLIALIPLCGAGFGAVVIYSFYRILERRMLDSAMNRCFVG